MDSSADGEWRGRSEEVPRKISGETQIGTIFYLFSSVSTYLFQGKIAYTSHDFWTYPHAFCDMKEAAPDLYEELAKSNLLIFKGDLNYRKLVGDRYWPWDYPFEVKDSFVINWKKIFYKMFIRWFWTLIRIRLAC